MNIIDIILLAWDLTLNMILIIYIILLYVLYSILYIWPLALLRAGGDQGILNEYFSGWAASPTNRLSFLYNVVHLSFYSYLPALKRCAPRKRVDFSCDLSWPDLMCLVSSVLVFDPRNSKDPFFNLLYCTLVFYLRSYDDPYELWTWTVGLSKDGRTSYVPVAQGTWFISCTLLVYCTRLPYCNRVFRKCSSNCWHLLAVPLHWLQH